MKCLTWPAGGARGVFDKIDGSNIEIFQLFEAPQFGFFVQNVFPHL